MYELAMLGKVSRLRRWVDDLIRRDKRYRPFAHKLRDLAKEFEIERLQAFLRSYLETIQ